MRMVVRRRVLLGLVALMLIIPVQILQAEVVPPAQDVFVMPGGEARLDIPLENSSSVGKTFSLSLLTASLPSGEESQPALSSLSPELAQWVSLVPNSISFEPNEQAVATLTVHPNENIEPGIYGVAVVATEKLEGQIALNHGSATLVFITVGQLSSSGVCTAWLRNDDGTFSVTLANDGGGILYENGAVQLRGPFGFSFGSTPLNPRRHRVLPEQARTWDTEPIAVPWWSFGNRSFVMTDNRLSVACAPIDAGFGWIPVVPLGAVFLGCAAVVLRRRR